MTAKKRCPSCCHSLPQTAFGSRFVKRRQVWIPYSKCLGCRNIDAKRYQERREEILAKAKTETAKSERNAKLANDPKEIGLRKAYSRLDETKERQRIRDALPENKQKLAAKRQLPISKQKRREYWNKEGIREREYARPSRAKAQKKRHEKIKNTPGLKLHAMMMASLRSRIKGTLLDEPTTLPKFTEFKSVANVIDHFESVKLPGMTLENHGDVWQIGHRIPCAWYDMEDEQEVRRCWHLGNIGCDWAPGKAPPGELSNQQKMIRLPPDDELIAMKEWFPSNWNGKLPSQPMRDAVFKRVYSRG